MENLKNTVEFLHKTWKMNKEQQYIFQKRRCILKTIFYYEQPSENNHPIWRSFTAFHEILFGIDKTHEIARQQLYYPYEVLDRGPKYPVRQRKFNIEKVLLLVKDYFTTPEFAMLYLVINN